MRAGVAVVAVAALVAACGGDDDGARRAASTTTVPLHVDDALADGRHFGFVTALDPARFRLVFDEAELLEGEEAVAAADEAGEVVTAGGFFVRNREVRMHRVTLSDDIVVRLRKPCCDLHEHAFEDWLAAFEPDERSFFGTAASHYWLTVEDGRVVEVEEAYLQ